VILDTNALSALLDKDSTLLDVIRESHELALPVIVLGEFRF
jgi:predicted nucleic acid-binding protein